MFQETTKNKKFTSEIEENGLQSFLDITITRENNKFLTSVYRKPTFSDVFTNFENFIPEMHKRGLIELCFIEVLDYDPVTRTFIEKLKL